MTWRGTLSTDAFMADIKEIKGGGAFGINLTRKAGENLKLNSVNECLCCAPDVLVILYV